MTASSVSGKTFLVGEYLAIDGGPSILLATNPRFILESGASVNSFAPASPAGRFLARHPRVGGDVGGEFRDPHRGKGGLGASSAQFALLYAAANGVAQIEPRSFDWTTMLAEYRACAWNGEGFPPSGADLVAQLNGGVTWFDGREFVARSLKWSFDTLSFTLVRTGTKLATHEHLRKSQPLPLESLRRGVRQATTAFETKEGGSLVGAVRMVRASLEEAGLTAPGTLALLHELDQNPWALASKGCGAMGADVVLVLHDHARTSDVAAWARGRDLELCGGLADLGEGLKVET